MELENKSTNKNNTEDAIYFNFSYAALKLLGKNLYNSAANAISELVANSLDAKATKVYVYIDMSDKEHSLIEILDNGSGMDYSDLADKYVWIGRNKRNESLDSKERQSIMGRKGIGKLAALYLSNQYCLLTKKDGVLENRWEVNLSKYQDWEFPKLDRVDQQVSLVNERIWKCFQSGTVIRLSNVDLRRNGDKKIESLRRVFADYYLLNEIGASIYVAVRTSVDDIVKFEKVEKKIAYKNFYALFDNSDLHIASKMRDSIAFVWASNYEHIKSKPRKTQLLDKDLFKTSGEYVYFKEDGTKYKKKYELTGWIGIHATIEQNNAVDKSFIRNSIYQPNKLRLYVRNKLAVSDYYSISPSTQAMANYIEGDISFDILDDDDLPDIATSSRQDFLEDERIKLLTSIVDPILSKLYKLRILVGNQINDENKEYADYLLKIEREEKEKEEKARKEAEAHARSEEKKRKEIEQEKAVAEEKQRLAEERVKEEKKRTRYIINVSSLEDKNILNSIHSIYNMSSRVKENLDEVGNNISNDINHNIKVKKSFEKAVLSNQRILAMSKIISKAGMVIDNNDAVRSVELSKFISQYVNDILITIYDRKLQIECRVDSNTEYEVKIKPLSFIMVIDNIVGNAIRADATRLLIVVDNSDEYFEIKFIDNGKGIDKSITDLNDVFEFGYTTTEGSGLGLYYAKKHISSLNGIVKLIPNSDNGVSVVLKIKK